MMNEQLQQLTRRTRQYWYIDGISELAFGGLCFLLALYFLSQALLPADSTLSSMLTTGFVLILVGAGLMTRKVIHTMKARLTYPRTGYVGYTHPNKNRRVLNMLVASLMGVLIAALMAGAPISLEWIPGVSGLLFGAAWLYFGSRVGLVRFYLLAAFSALAGVSISLAHIPEDTGLAAYYALLGAAMLVSGGLTLWGYLRSTNLPEAEPSGEEVQ